MQSQPDGRLDTTPLPARALAYIYLAHDMAKSFVLLFPGGNARITTRPIYSPASVPRDLDVGNFFLAYSDGIYPHLMRVVSLPVPPNIDEVFASSARWTWDGTYVDRWIHNDNPFLYNHETCQWERDAEVGPQKMGFGGDDDAIRLKMVTQFAEFSNYITDILPSYIRSAL